MGAISDAVQDLADLEWAAGLPVLGTCRMRVVVGDDTFTVSIDDGAVGVYASGEGDEQFDFTYSLDQPSWEAFCSDPPPHGYTTAQAIYATHGGACVKGDHTAWAQYALVLDRILESLREQSGAPRRTRHRDPSAADGPRSQIAGGYVNVPVSGEDRRIYFEEAGSGQVVLCLHTAAADSRQFRYLLEDQELSSRYRFVAFDMPWHGRSDPPTDWATTNYYLETETYAETILSFMDVLDLEQPILLGCSAGASIALYLASWHGDRFRAVCALEASLGNPTRFVDWSNHLEIDHSHFLPSWVAGLMSPQAPEGPRNQTLWAYAQSGPGIYHGDSYFYSQDFPKHAGSLKPATCPVWVFNGEYDYSATLEMSRAAADKIGGKLVEMKGTGHFPMSEDPENFRSFFVPVLDEISERRRP